MSGWQALRYDDYRLMQWKNGAGMTREILRYPPEDDDFKWRLSMAEVAQAGEFSAYHGYQRLLSVLRGSGMALRIDAAPAKTLYAFDTQAFSGDSRVDSELVDGPILDFNLIYQAEYFNVTLRWLTIGAQEQYQLNPDVTTLIFSAASNLTLSSTVTPRLLLQRYDCAILPPQSLHSDLLNLQINGSGYWSLLELRSIEDRPHITSSPRLKD